MMDLILGFFVGLGLGAILYNLYNHIEKSMEFKLRHKISHLEDEKRELESDLIREKSNSEHLRDSLTDKNHTNKQLIRIIKELGYEIEYCQWGFNLKKIKENEDD